MSGRGSTSVNDQIVDAVRETNAVNIGTAEAGSKALLDIVMAQTVGMSMHNAVTAQHNDRMVAEAAVAATCARLLAAHRLPQPVSPKRGGPTTNEKPAKGKSPTPGK